MNKRNRPLLYHFDHEGKVVHFQSISDLHRHNWESLLDALKPDMPQWVLDNFKKQLEIRNKKAYTWSEKRWEAIKNLPQVASWAPEGSPQYVLYAPDVETIEWFWPSPVHQPNGSMEFIITPKELANE